MGVIICNKKQVKEPLYIESLDINIYSIEELAYLIYTHPILAMDNLINDNLFKFISESLELINLKNWILKIYRENRLNDDILYYILDASGFYTKNEIAKYKKKIENLRALSKYEFEKCKADYNFELRKYSKAIELYERILSLEKPDVKNIKFIGSIYNNLAAAYSKIFYFNKAYLNYRYAYECIQDKRILKYLVYLEKLGVEAIEEVDSLITEKERLEWEKEFDNQRQEILASKEIENLKSIFNYDSIKRANLLKQKIFDIRQEYRAIT